MIDPGLIQDILVIGHHHRRYILGHTEQLSVQEMGLDQSGIEVLQISTVEIVVQLQQLALLQQVIVDVVPNEHDIGRIAGHRLRVKFVGVVGRLRVFKRHVDAGISLLETGYDLVRPECNALRTDPTAFCQSDLDRLLGHRCPRFVRGGRRGDAGNKQPAAGSRSPTGAENRVGSFALSSFSS